MFKCLPETVFAKLHYSAAAAAVLHREAHSSTTMAAETEINADENLFHFSSARISFFSNFFGCCFLGRSYPLLVLHKNERP